MFSKFNKWISIIIFLLVLTMLYFDIFRHITYLIKLGLNILILISMILVILKFINNIQRKIQLNVKSIINYFNQINFKAPLKWLAFYYLISIFNILYLIIPLITLNTTYIKLLNILLFILIISYIVFLVILYISYIICNQLIRFILKLHWFIKSIKLIYKNQRKQNFIFYLQFKAILKTFKKALSFEESELNYFKKIILQTETKRINFPV